MNDYRISAEQLKANCELDQFDFQTTDDIDPVFSLQSQQKAVEALKFGLGVEKPGYNIFAADLSCPEEKEYLVSFVQQKADQEESPPDICYVYNFSQPEKPRLITLPAGKGTKFKQDMDQFIAQLQQSVDQMIDGKEYNQQCQKLKSKYKNKIDQLWEELKEEVKEWGYLVEREEDGLGIIPLLNDGQPMSEEEYEELTPEQKEQIRATIQEIQTKIDQVMVEIKSLHQEYEQELADLKQKSSLQIIEPLLEPLFTKYQDFSPVISFLQAVKEDIVINGKLFTEQEDGLLLRTTSREEDKFKKYRVNLLVDNAQQKGAPVVVEDNPTYYNLIGRVEYETRVEKLETDFLNIKPGVLQKANGGYLILKADKLVSKFAGWEALKQTLKQGKLRMENLGVQYEKLPMITLVPEAIPLDVKVILLGSHRLYQFLNQYDAEFNDLFNFKAEFADDINWGQESNYQLARFVSYQCDKQDLRAVTKSGVARIIEELARQNNHQQRVTTDLSLVTKLLIEADQVADKRGQELITKAEIKQVVTNRHRWSGKTEAKVHQLYQEEQILLSTSGTEVGQVNGLSIIDQGDYQFGKPVKITAVAYKGKQGVINIEREVKLSGKLHDKGVMILAGYLGDNFAQEVALPLSASICFEQLYSEIEGDSASSAELYALLSALAEIPIRQEVAVTGSINQKGSLQPVGEITNKIEGYFDLCRQNGLTGEQGVIVPQQNLEHLMLKEAVINAVNNNRFHIYAIDHVEAGIQILLREDQQDLYDQIQKKVKYWADEG